MDRQSGRFIKDTPNMENMQTLAKGESIMIKGVEFEVTDMHEDELLLKMLSSAERIQKHTAEVGNRSQRRADNALAKKINKRGRRLNNRLNRHSREKG